jgi:hypothetical protein
MPPAVQKYEQLHLEVHEEELEQMPWEEVIQILKDSDLNSDRWQVLHENNTARIDSGSGFIMCQNACTVGFGTYKYILSGQFETDLGNVMIFRHCSLMHPPVLVREIPGPTMVLNLTVTKLDSDTVTVDAHYLSGSLAWSANCNILEDNKALRLRARILNHLVAIGRASPNTSISLVLANTTKVLRGSSLIWEKPRRGQQPCRRPAGSLGIRRYMK